MKLLQEWFLASKRSLPWREEPSPYAVWVSEVMLQQTRASVVVPYFLRWMRLFPTIEVLAKAPREEVLKAWEGLGYYSRARNLHEGAKSLSGLPFPKAKEELLKVKGIGAYTAGAILSFAYKERAAAVDGNVLRVLARYFGLEKNLYTAKGAKELEEKTLSLLPEEDPWIVMEGLIELGALVCSKKPACSLCPLKASCIAHKEGKEEILPLKKQRAQTTYLQKVVAVVLFDNEVLLHIGKEGKVFAGLAQFPSFPNEIEKNLPLDLLWQEDLPRQKQTYTIYQEELVPSVFVTKEKRSVPGFFWCKQEELEKYTFSSGHKRIFESFFS